MNTVVNILENMDIDAMKTIDEVAKTAAELAFALNGGFTTRSREHTGDKPTAFINFSGHVGEMEIRIHKTGWFTKKNASEEKNKEFLENRKTFELGKPFQDLEDNKRELKKLIELVKELL